VYFSCLAHTLSPTISLDTLLPDSVSLSAADEEGTRLVKAKIAKRGLAKAWQSVAILAGLSIGQGWWSVKC